MGAGSTGTVRNRVSTRRRSQMWDPIPCLEAEIAREQAKRLADKYITRSGELVMPVPNRIGANEPTFLRNTRAGARERGR